MITEDIYRTCGGEVLINYKWNLYGKYYYMVIWMGFMALFGCFIVAATFTEESISNDIRKRLFTASIILRIIHSTFELRQFIYNHK